MLVLGNFNGIPGHIKCVAGKISTVSIVGFISELWNDIRSR
jgi:hypothetical protein